MDEELELALLEGIWIMRWNKEQTAMSAVLTSEEALQMCKDMVEELDRAGYEIVKKEIKTGDVSRIPVVGDQLQYKRDFLNMFQLGEIYEIYLKENHLGGVYYLFNVNTGEEISDYGLKSHQINFYFKFLN
jgi:hypothetical protein